MFAGEDIAFNGLEICNYRHLQGMAKNMGLPSNVKKVHLIEMIRAKKYCTDTDLNALVNRVKMERKVNAQAKKKKQKKKHLRLQAAEISSTSNSHSPPISVTPKRATGVRLQYSPDLTIMKYQPRPNIIQPGTSILQKNCNNSDRVLRSFNSLKRPNYRIMEQSNCVTGVVKTQNSVQEIRKELVQERAFQSVNVTAEASQKHRPIMNTLVLNRDRQLVPISRCSNTGPEIVKRKLSGIYPLQPRERSFYESVPTIGFRRSDGRVTKINAVIQKPQSNAIMPKNSQRPIVVTVKDVINYKVEHPSVNLTRPKAIEAGNIRLYPEIDYQPNRIDNQSNETDIDYQSEINYQSNKVDSQSIGIQCQSTEARAKPRSNEINKEICCSSEPIYSTSQPRDMGPNLSRKVFKGRQPLMNKVVSNKPWQYSVDYQEHENIDTGKEWNIYDIDGQPMNTDESSKAKTYSHTVKEVTEPPTDRERITEPISKTYQKEYQQFNVDMKKRYTNTKYPNMQALTDSFPNEEYSQVTREDSDYSVYYHKKIRAEQVRSLRGKDIERLPRINDAFSQFNDVQYKCLTQPLYVQVSKESERVPLPMLMQANNINNTCMLESIYNFKNQFVTNPPVMIIATTQTNCTYSTRTVTTAVAQPVTHTCNNNSHEQPRSSQKYEPEFIPRLYDYLKPDGGPYTNIGCDEALSSSTNSLETTNSQELGANVTIPDMVEDALELISQDGDYMERIGMDVRVQCIICDWAGPKIILEYHIKKEHPYEIQQQEDKEWSILVTLGELISKQTWSSQVIQYNDILYVISSKYRETDVIMISLSIIPTEIETPTHGRITVYNKISGKPYTFEAEIKHIPDSMPYEYGLDCLVLDIGDLDLIPNSANLKLVNRELVGSPAKVVVGQPELKNVEIVVYVKLLD